MTLQWTQALSVGVDEIDDQHRELFRRAARLLDGLKKGEPVILELVSEDRIHGFKMPDFGLRADIVPGQETRVSLTPDKAGSFAFFCDVFCGDGHEDMDGTLVVGA